MLRRSQLFVPANDERKIRKSLTLPADSLIFDLEDAVPLEEKANARMVLSKMLSELDWGKREICVRINKVGASYSKEDIDFVEKENQVNCILLPKAEEIPNDLQKKTGKALLPLIETAKGLLKMEEIVRSNGVDAVSYGPADFANSVGGRTEAYSQNVFVKSKIVVVASAYGIDSIDGVYFDLENLQGFRNEATMSRDLGYVGKHAVHPSQIGIANEVYTPSQADVSNARSLIEIYEKSARGKVGALRLDEKLVDAVHYRRARALLEKAEVITKLAKSE